jgi:hypothetical protein
MKHARSHLYYIHRVLLDTPAPTQSRAYGESGSKLTVLVTVSVRVILLLVTVVVVVVVVVAPEPIRQEHADDGPPGRLSVTLIWRFLTGSSTGQD